MIIFNEIKIENFRNIKHTILRDLKDFNILIGPNNCGKTNILELINSFSNIKSEQYYKIYCSSCNKFKEKKKLEGLCITLKNEDFYLKKYSKGRKIKISILLNDETIKKLIPRVIEKRRDILKEAPCQEIKNEILLENEDEYPHLYSKHLSPFIHSDVLNEIKKWVLYCPEGRLQQYKGKDFREYLREKNFSGAEKMQLIDFIARVVDPRIDDYDSGDLIRKVNGGDLTVTIAEQGSGIRSLICLVTDILALKDARILLIDEPELGLNPLAKQEFLKFLFSIATEKQIFFATQDSTFVNPILWKEYTDKVSVYLFSLLDENFVKVDLSQNKEDPNVFAGYLPHTASLKEVHIYVEGSSDVYIFQVLLRKFLRSYKKNWSEIENKIGIFHLCGDFWMHLLYTIPKPPYKCIIILDGDKRRQAEEVVKKHNRSITNASRFELINSINGVKELFKKSDRHPVYCLQKSKIEDYLFPNSPHQGYNKRIDGPKAAEKIKKLPEEIEELFKAIING